MANTHGIADFAKELQATSADLLPACIVSNTPPTVPASSLTLPAFATKGYVKDGIDLVYVEQEAHTVTLAGGDGNYWLGLAQDTFTAYASWNRTAGTHYVWRLNATEPASIDGLLCWCQVTVAGGVITAVTPLTKVCNQPMSKQNSNAVAITGGAATLSQVVSGTTIMSAQGFQQTDVAGNNIVSLYSTLNAAGGTNRYAVNCGGTAPSYFGGTVQVVGKMGVQGAPSGFNGLDLYYVKASTNGLGVRPTDTDGGGGAAISFLNVGQASVGSIVTNATTTTYNTSSDVRLKHSIQPLTGALARLLALKPITHRWNVDDSPGESFLAHELQQHVPLAVTGLPDEVHPDGSIKPQQVDHSKLVPHLVAAIQELSAQVQALTARITDLEAALA